jgi:hypothetical protein
MRPGLGITGSSYLQNSADEGFARDVKIWCGYMAGATQTCKPICAA